MQPIHYSLALNGLIIVLATVLTVYLANPLLFVIGLMMVHHFVERFRNDNNDDDDPGPDGQPGMGFLA